MLLCYYEAEHIFNYFNTNNKLCIDAKIYVYEKNIVITEFVDTVLPGKVDPSL